MHIFNSRLGLSVLFISGIMSLTSCATLSPAECQTADWYRIGEQDGSEGYPSRLAQHFKACQKINIEPNQGLYVKGYNEGVRYYCQPQVILNAALVGKGNANVCPAQSRATLDDIRRVGHAVYEAERTQENLERRRIELVRLLEDKKMSLQDRLKRSEELNEVYKALRDHEVELGGVHQQLIDLKHQYRLK